MKNFFKLLGKFSLSFLGGAVAAAGTTAMTGNTNSTALIASAIVGGITTAIGHGVTSPLTPTIGSGQIGLTK